MKTRNIEDVQLDFLISALSHGNFISTTDILMWMKQQNEDVVSNIKQIPIEQLKGWNYRDDRICHDSGKFFSIDGIHIMTNYRNVPEWDQPIINQPEMFNFPQLFRLQEVIIHVSMEVNLLIIWSILTVRKKYMYWLTNCSQSKALASFISVIEILL